MAIRADRTEPNQKPLRRCHWAFDFSPIYEGWTDDTYWNGFLNVCVTPETRAKVVQDIRAGWLGGDPVDGDQDSADDIAALPVFAFPDEPTERVWLANGWAICEAPPPPPAERTPQWLGRWLNKD
jgi:hypothetical protein